MVWLFKAWAWLFGGKAVWLKDFDGEFNLSIGKMGPDGQVTAQRWFFTDSPVTLNPDGTTSGLCYVKEWALAD